MVFYLMPCGCNQDISVLIPFERVYVLRSLVATPPAMTAGGVGRISYAIAAWGRGGLVRHL